MNHKKVINILKKLQNNIFMRLDKDGTYRSINEDSARGIVRNTIENQIESIRAYYEEEKRPIEAHTDSNEAKPNPKVIAKNKKNFFINCFGCKIYYE